MMRLVVSRLIVIKNDNREGGKMKHLMTMKELRREAITVRMVKKWIEK